MPATGDQIASLVQQRFAQLPAKRKPTIRDNGAREWVPLSGIVAKDEVGNLHCLCLATGMKCLPASQIPQANGIILHDWHAEVLALRAFNKFVLDECHSLASCKTRSSPFLQRRETRSQREDAVEAHKDEDIAKSKKDNAGGDEEQGWHGQPFAWKAGVKLYMYCSEAPCGDASMELVMSAQEDATPWSVPSPPNTSSPTPSSHPVSLPGRAYFSQLGLTRRKPSRPDAPPTLSKSCSDKVALGQFLSPLCSVVSLLVDPASVQVDCLVLPRAAYSETGCERAFGAREGVGRLSPAIVDTATAGNNGGCERGGFDRKKEGAAAYAFRPFTIQTTDLEFEFSRRTIEPLSLSKSPLSHAAPPTRSPVKTTSSNLSVIWTSSGLDEAIQGGVLQGRRVSDPRGASGVSRQRMWKYAQEVVEQLAGTSYDGSEVHERGSVQDIRQVLSSPDYRSMKGSGLLEVRRRMKEHVTNTALKGWIKNSGDDEFSLGVA